MTKKRTQMAQTITRTLDNGFVFVDDVKIILSLAFVGGKNAILFGPGGHAKSQMLEKVVEALGAKDETFVQFFGEGMDEARLYGGLNFEKLEKEHVLEYYPERSFLNYRIAIFEELFDAPANVLLALKDVLTSKELRNGAQRFPMRTEVIICLTNKEPAEIADLGPAAEALIERFPLQLNVKWDSYDKSAYEALFRKTCQNMAGPSMTKFQSILAEVLANATATGNFVSPRTAVHAFQVCQTAAMVAGRDSVVKEDLVNLRFLPGLEVLAKSLQADIEAAMERDKGEKALSGYQAEYHALYETMEREHRPIQLLQVSKKATELLDRISTLKVPDSLVSARKELRNKVSDLSSKAQVKALDLTRL